MINFMWMLRQAICEMFDLHAGTWQSGQPAEKTFGLPMRSALLIHFTLKKKKVKMLIHAPANYVGVYIKDGKSWKCIGYHDSCWRNTVERFLSEHQEDIHFDWFSGKPIFKIEKKLTNSIHVVELDDTQIAGLREVRKEKGL